MRTTPVFAAEIGGRPVALKLENLQVTGSFKFRGALNGVIARGAAARQPEHVVGWVSVMNAQARMPETAVRTAATRLAELPDGADIVAYCRGRYCVFAPAAVRLLRPSGFSARPLDRGLPGWRLAGLSVTAGANA